MLISLKHKKGFIHLLPGYEEPQLAQVILWGSPSSLCSSTPLTELNSQSCLSSTLST